LEKTRTAKFLLRSKTSSMTVPSSKPKFFLISEGIETRPLESIFSLFLNFLEAAESGLTKSEMN